MSTPKVQLKLQPVPRNTMRIAVAGEFMKNMGLNDDAQIRNVQQAVAEGLVRELTVAARNSSGLVKELFHLQLDKLERDDVVMVDLSGGKTHLEALDVSVAGQVAYWVEFMRRRGLRPEFFIDWSSYARANPTLIADACRRLNFRMNSGPQLQHEAADDLFTANDDPSPPQQRSSSESVTTCDGPPSLPPDYFYRRVLEIMPAKDPGIRLIHESARRRT